MKPATCAAAIMSACLPALLFAQAAPAPLAHYDAVSIKRSAPDAASAGIRSLPDGTLIMTNQPIRSIIYGAAPVPVREVIGLPDWAETERYDLTARPPEGATREQERQMTRAMFAERMKLVGHVEQRERNTFALVLARSDGKLGPQLTPSPLDCNARPAGPSQTLRDPSGPTSRCGVSFGDNSIASGGITMDLLVQSLGGFAGGLVNNRTGLQGWYALTLTFAQPVDAQSAGTPPRTDLPAFSTALQEQLGLKLQPEKTMVPVFVVDHIERPTEN